MFVFFSPGNECNFPYSSLFFYMHRLGEHPWRLLVSGKVSGLGIDGARFPF